MNFKKRLLERVAFFMAISRHIPVDSNAILKQVIIARRYFL